MATGRAGSDIELELRGGPDAAKATAYRALPAAGRGKAVLVVDGAGGLGDFARDVCDRLARAGFVALAPDVPDEGASRPRIAAGVRALLDDVATDGPRVGAVGFGAAAGWILAGGDPEGRLGCRVLCGGALDADSAGATSLPTLLLFGEEDPDAAAAQAVCEALPHAHLRRLPEAGAGFMDPARADRFAASASASAWDAALAFLEASL